MLEVFRNDFFVVRGDSPNAVVEVTRTRVNFTSAQQAAACYTPMLECLDSLGRHRYSLLLDARESVANNDPEYESWQARFRAELFREFRRAAVLVKTPVGSLQATRLLPPSAGVARVFLDFDQAWAFVTEPLSMRSSRRPPRNDDPSFESGVTSTPASSGRAQPPRGRTRLPPTG